MPAANCLATCSSLVLVLHGTDGLLGPAEGYSVVSIMALIKELTGIAAVGVESEAAGMEIVCSGAVDGIGCGGGGDLGSDFTCLLLVGGQLSRLTEGSLTAGGNLDEVSVCAAEAED